ncbi:hypothetical protein ABW19_dt0204531 [Dactylella cylindrospora]|nr:hypothetical protein ABW19_dt0204531 [Dactylella cylindrospora]
MSICHRGSNCESSQTRYGRIEATGRNAFRGVFRACREKRRDMAYLEFFLLVLDIGNNLYSGTSSSNQSILVIYMNGKDIINSSNHSFSGHRPPWLGLSNPDSYFRAYSNSEDFFTISRFIHIEAW